MKKRFFFLLWLLGGVGWLATPSCRKLDRDSVSGKVLEYGTEKPIAGAVVKLFGWSGSPLSGGSSFLVDSTTTDANGAYHFDDDAMFAPSMTANAYKSLYFTGYDSETVVADGRFDNTNIYLKPYAWLNIKVINKNGQYFYFIGPGQTLNGINVEEWINQNDSFQYYRVLKGNLESPFIFSVWDKAGGNYLKDTSLIKFYVNSKLTKLKSLESGDKPDIMPPGQDTTDITIIF